MILKKKLSAVFLNELLIFPLFSGPKNVCGGIQTSKLVHIAINSIIPIDLNSLQHTETWGAVQQDLDLQCSIFFSLLYFFSCEEIS